MMGKRRMNPMIVCCACLLAVLPIVGGESLHEKRDLRLLRAHALPAPTAAPVLAPPTEAPPSPDSSPVVEDTGAPIAGPSVEPATDSPTIEPVDSPAEPSEPPTIDPKVDTTIAPIAPIDPLPVPSPVVMPVVDPTSSPFIEPPPPSPIAPPPAVAPLAPVTDSPVAAPFNFDKLSTVSLGARIPGGIAFGKGVADGQLYTTSLFFGGVRLVDIVSGRIRPLVPDLIFRQRLFYGLDFDEATGTMFVAGSELVDDHYEGRVFVHDKLTGEPIAACEAENFFPTDVAVVDEAIYATNSHNNDVIVIKVEDALSGDCTVNRLSLPLEFNASEDEFDALFIQGVEGYGEGLILVHSPNGEPGVFYYDFVSGSITKIADAPTSGSSVVISENSQLFISDSVGDRVSVYSLCYDGGIVDAKPIGFIEVPAPSYGALHHDDILYTVGAFDESLEGFVALASDTKELTVTAPVPVATATPVTAPIESEFPEVISLGQIQPGGIVGEGDLFFVATQLSGGILAVDARNGNIGVLSPTKGPFERVLFGLKHDESRPLLYAAGANFIDGSSEGRIFVYSTNTGEEVAACGFPESEFYPTDVTSIGNSVYATNSLGSNLFKMDADAASMGECTVETIDLPPGLFSSVFNPGEVEGIDRYAGGLILSSTVGSKRELFYFDTETEILSAIADAPSSGGGLLVDESTSRLYAPDPAMNLVRVYNLESDGGVTATLIGSLESELIGAPSFVAVGSNDKLYIPSTLDEFALVSIDSSDIDPFQRELPLIQVAATTVQLGPAHPGGITLGSGALKNQLFISNLFFGGIRVLDLVSGDDRVLQPNMLYLERTAFGMDYDEENELLFVAGSETIDGNMYAGLLYAYDPFTGEEVVACRIPDFFPTDVAVVGSTVYTTNTLANNLIVATSPASGNCQLDEILLPEGFVSNDFDPSVIQGIVPYANGLILVSIGDKRLYYYDLATETFTDIAEGPASGGGLDVADDQLFVTDTALDRILVYSLASEDGGVKAEAVGALESDLLEGPTYPVVFLGNLYTANSLFSTEEATDNFSLVVQNVVSLLPFRFPNPITLETYRPGGITTGEGLYQDQLFISNLFFGGILVVDVTTGTPRVLLGNMIDTGRTAFGLACAKESGHLFVAGSESGVGTLFVIDIATGEQMAACDAPDFFPTDVEIVGNTAYATNSLGSNLMAVDVAAAVMGTCDVNIIELAPELFMPSDFEPGALYGLTSYEDGLIMASKNDGQSTLFYLDLADESLTELAPGPMDGVGGLVVNRNQLIVTDPTFDALQVFDLESDEDVVATASSPILNRGFQAPLASGVYKDSFVYTLNSEPTDGEYLIFASEL